MSTEFHRDPEFVGAALKPSVQQRFKIIEVLFVVAIFGLPIALVMPRTSCCNGPVMREVQCQNNLKQIALALLTYKHEYQVFPPAYTLDAQGRPLHSWRTLILPYLDQYDPDLENKNLYETIDLSKPWNDPSNAKALATPIHCFRCPETRGLLNGTNYLAIVANNGCLLPTKPRPLADITDDHGSTLMVIEVDDEKAVPWMAPTDADESLVLKLVAQKSTLQHIDGMNVGFVDGSVRLLKANTKPDVRRALLSISGGEKLKGF